MRREISFNLGLPELPLTQNQELFQELISVYNAVRNCAYSLDSYTGTLSSPADSWAASSDQIRLAGMAKVYYIAGEDLSPGATVCFYADAGVTKVRKANGTTYRCRGFCNMAVAITAGTIVEVILLGRYPEFPPNTLVPGATYYQATTPGQIGADGYQAVGYAITDQILFFNPTV